MKENRSLRPSAAAFLLMMAMAVTTSALSFFVSPVCSDLNIGRGSFSVYFSLMTASGAASTPFLGRYINKNGVKRVMFLSGLWCCAGLLLFSLCDSLWMFYLAGAALGLFGTSCVSLCANVIVQSSYSGDQASGILGFVMAGSGVGGMLFSLILPGILERFGWRLGYRFLAVCWLVMVLGAFALMGRQETAGNIGSRKTPLPGMTQAEALKSAKFYLMVASIFIYTAGCGIQQHIPSLLEGMAFSTTQISLMVSVMTAGLAVGKIVQGILYSRIGIRAGGSIITLLFAAGFLLLTSSRLVYPGLVSLAFGMGLVTTLMPIVTRFVFGAREFASIWGLLATASSVGSFLSTPVWGMVYDGFGSYDPALLVSPVLLAAALAAMLLALKEQK